MTQSILRSSYGVALMYHRVGMPRVRSIVTGQYVCPRLLSGQIDYLCSHGLSSVSLPELADTQASCPGFAITFDDGYLSVYSKALPVLLSKRVAATVFVVAGAMGGINEWDIAGRDVVERLLGADHIREMADMGFEIGSHTMTHARLSQLPPADLQREVSDSKKLLEDVVGREVSSFCYPYGDYTPAVIDAVQEAGYKRATTTRRATVKADSPPLEIPRINVRWNHLPFLLGKKIALSEQQ